MDARIKSVTARTKNKQYNILIGDSVLSQIKSVGSLLSGERFSVIVSSNVLKLYSAVINETFSSYKNYNIYEMRDGEENKNFRYAEEFLNKLLINGCSRKSFTIAIGGGVTGDFAGFISSVFMRGIPIIHIPTTLLAMVDSSIGGKVAVNLAAGKNIAGAFHQPEMVLSDINFLKSLPDNELKNGLTEVLKHAIIGEDGILNILKSNDLNSIRDPKNLTEIVYLSALFKSKIVEEDERDTGKRAILNYGHTAGHAIESLMELSGISHGEAVAIGLKIETEISRRLGWLEDNEQKTIIDLIDKYNLARNKYDLSAAEIIDHMKYDKKNFSGKVKFVLLKGIGNPVYNQEVNIDLLRDVISDIL